MKTYKRDNCDCYIRQTVTVSTSRRIVLSGRFAFEWSISEYLDIDNKISVTTTIYPTGKIAREEFRRLKQKYKVK